MQIVEISNSPWSKMNTTKSNVHTLTIANNKIVIKAAISNIADKMRLNTLPKPSAKSLNPSFIEATTGNWLITIAGIQNANKVLRKDKSKIKIIIVRTTPLRPRYEKNVKRVLGVFSNLMILKY